MKKLMSVLLMAVMIVTFAAGCGSVTSSVSSAESTGGTSSTAPAEPVTVKVWGPNNVEEFGAGEDENNNAIIEYLREYTSLDIQWMIAPKEGATEKLNLLMTAGGSDCPDMIVSGDRTIGLEYVSDGLLKPIEEYLPQATNLTKCLDDSAQQMMTYEGKQYAVVVPQNQEATAAYVARTDLLKEAGITKNPVSVDEYVAMLQTLKGKYNIAPLTGTGSTDPLNAFAGFSGAYGVATDWRVNGDSLECSWITDDMKQLLTLAAQLYAEGLLDKEYAVNKSDSVTEKLINGTAIVAWNYWSDLLAKHKAFAEKNANASVDTIGVAYTKDGIGGTTMNGPARIYFYFPIYSEVTQETMMLVDAYCVKDVQMITSYGWENEHYTIGSDGVINATDKASEIAYRIYYQLWDTKENFLNRCKLKGFYPDYSAMKPYSTIEDPMWYVPVISVKQDKDSALKDLKDSYFIKIITGAYSIDKFDEFVSKWKSSGGDEVTAAVNEWYKNQ